MCLESSSRHFGLEKLTALAREAAPPNLTPKPGSITGHESESREDSHLSGNLSGAVVRAFDKHLEQPGQAVRLSNRELVAHAVQASLKETLKRAEESELAQAHGTLLTVLTEAASSKDTNTLDRSHSPRNSKSVGTVTQKGLDEDQQQNCAGRFDAEDASLSSLSEQVGKVGLRIYPDPCTPRVLRAGSDASNNSRLPSPSDDLHTADSHHASRIKSGSHAGQTSNACSGSYHARDGEDREEIQSRGVSEQRESPGDCRATPTHNNATQRNVAPLAPQKKGSKRPRSAQEEGGRTQDVKRPVKPSVPPLVRTLESSFEEAASLKKGRGFLRPFSVPAAPPKPDEGNLSRACSDVRPQVLDEPLPDQEEKPLLPDEEEKASLPDGEEKSSSAMAQAKALRKQPRSKAARHSNSGSNPRRSGRVAALDTPADCTEADEDYIPPGEVVEAFQANGPKKVRASRTRSAALPKPCLASSSVPPPPSLPRSNSRLRWSGSIGSSVASPLSSPAGSRRLRSQPLDVSSLIPDAFAFEAPCAKRPKHSVLQSGLAALKLLEEESKSHCTLTRSKGSGLCKPYPAWQTAPEMLRKKAGDDVSLCREKQPADFQQLDDQPSRVPNGEFGDAAERLGQSALAKAIRASQKATEAFQRQSDEPKDSQGSSLLHTARSIMPDVMRTACESWEERLNAPTVGVFGEPTTCLKARVDRNLQNIWDDLLSRHALETGILENFAAWLEPGPVE